MFLIETTVLVRARKTTYPLKTQFMIHRFYVNGYRQGQVRATNSP